MKRPRRCYVASWWVNKYYCMCVQCSDGAAVKRRRWMHVIRAAQLRDLIVYQQEPNSPVCISSTWSHRLHSHPPTAAVSARLLRQPWWWGTLWWSVSHYVCLSVCLSVCYTILMTGWLTAMSDVFLIYNLWRNNWVGELVMNWSVSPKTSYFLPTITVWHCKRMDSR